MATKAQREVPAGMQRICRRFQCWRSSHRGRLPILEGLWVSAAAAAQPRWISGGRTQPGNPAAFKNGLRLKGRLLVK